MSITGYQFDKAKVTVKADSSLYDYLSLNRNGIISGRSNELGVSTNGLICTIDTGQAIIQGRLIEITSPELVTIPANSSGYLCITIDLSQTNSSTGTPGETDYSVVIGQLRVEFVNTLVNQDLFNGGAIYNLNLGRIVSNESTVTYTKNLDIYTQLIRLPNGAILGNTLSDYDSVISGNRWYANEDNLYIEPALNKMLVVRQKGTTETYLPIKASNFIGTYDISWTNLTTEGIFTQSTTRPLAIRCKKNTVTISGTIIANGEINTTPKIICSLPSVAYYPGRSISESYVLSYPLSETEQGFHGYSLEIVASNSGTNSGKLIIDSVTSFTLTYYSIDIYIRYDLD